MKATVIFWCMVCAWVLVLLLGANPRLADGTLNKLSWGCVLVLATIALVMLTGLLPID